VSGTAALIRAQRPDWPGSVVHPPQVRNRVYNVLLNSGVPFVPQNPEHEGLLGRVRISAGGAVLENPVAPPLGDVNADGTVGAPDIAMVLSSWGPAPTFVRADLNADGAVDARDLTILLTYWGR